MSPVQLQLEKTPVRSDSDLMTTRLCLLTSVLWILLAATAAEAQVPPTCHNFAGRYEDDNHFVFKLEQKGCEEIAMWFDDTSPDRYFLNCQPFRYQFTKAIACWQSDRLKMYILDHKDRKFMNRQWIWDAQGNYREETYLMDDSGAEKLYQTYRFKRLVDGVPRASLRF